MSAAEIARITPDAVDAARDRARAEGRPIRRAEVDELLRVLDDGGALPDADRIGGDL